MTEAKQSLLTNSILLNRQYQGMFQAKLLANQNQEKGNYNLELMMELHLSRFDSSSVCKAICEMFIHYII